MQQSADRFFRIKIGTRATPFYPRGALQLIVLTANAKKSANGLESVTTSD